MRACAVCSNSIQKVLGFLNFICSDFFFLHTSNFSGSFCLMYKNVSNLTILRDQGNLEPGEQSKIQIGKQYSMARFSVDFQQHVTIQLIISICDRWASCQLSVQFPQFLMCSPWSVTFTLAEVLAYQFSSGRDLQRYSSRSVSLLLWVPPCGSITVGIRLSLLCKMLWFQRLLNCPQAKSRWYIPGILTSPLFCHWLLVHQQNSLNKQVVWHMDPYWAAQSRKSGKTPHKTKLGLPDFLKDDF